MTHVPPPGGTPRDERLSGVAAAVLAALLFGSAYVVTAVQLRAFTPLGGAFWRACIALAFLVVVAASSRAARAARPASGDRQWSAARIAPLLVLGVLGGLVFIAGMNLAISHVGATVTAFVAGLYAILAALFAPALLGERLGRRALAGFVLALVGTGLLAELNPSAATVDGLVAAIVAAVAYGLYLVLIRRWSRAIDVGPVGISLVTAGTSTVGLGLFLGFTDPAGLIARSASPDTIVATAWLAVVTALGPLLATAALRRIEAGLASSFLLLNPISATVLAVVLLGQWPSALQLAGGALVLAGIVLATGGPPAFERARIPGRHLAVEWDEAAAADAGRTSLPGADST